MRHTSNLSAMRRKTPMYAGVALEVMACRVIIFVQKKKKKLKMN